MIVNLAIELDALDDEIATILNNQHHGIDWILAEVFDEAAARKIMGESIKAIHRRLAVIVKDYGKLLSRKDIAYIKKRIDDIRKRLKIELVYERLKPMSEQDYVDELGQIHTITEKDFRNSYEKEISNFVRSVDTQKMRLDNYYERIAAERWRKRFELWIPIILSTLSLIISIITAFMQSR